MAKYQISNGDFQVVLMRVSAAGHNIDVSGVDRDALAWFLNSAFARGLQGNSRGGQSGSKRQLLARTPEWLWRVFQQHVGEGPVAASGHDPLLITLPDLRAKDAAIIFDGLVLEMLKTSDWDANRFVKHRGVKTIRETIHRETRFQYGV